MFWTLGHIPPSHRATAFDLASLPNGTSFGSVFDIPKPPILVQGTATVTEIFTHAQLELSIIAVSAGLAISITLRLLAIASLLFYQRSTDDKDRSVDGTGILHAIWLYRYHPELDSLLEKVEHPTDDNLRAAGLVQTKSVGGSEEEEERLILGSLEWM
ncbi:hypothetical protein B0H13DRAFT_2364535 [Mycena leptocephala]|nr:hypothetical protein B0H13DRAFT_2364535 [Mycena leptocephala]